MRDIFHRRSIVQWLLVGFGGLFLFFFLWGWSKEPNLHRIRASIIFQRLDAGELTKPQTGKIASEKSTPQSLKEIVKETTGSIAVRGNEFVSALQLARLLVSKNFPAVSAAATGPEIKLNRIGAGKAAYCSDYTEAFIGLCLAAGIPVREWGITADELKGPNGHSLVEVWDGQAGRWLIVDPFVGGWPSKTDRPGKGIGIAEYMNESKANIRWHAISEVSLKGEVIETVYNAAAPAMFLIENQRIFQPVEEAMPVVIRQLIHIVTGNSFRFSFPEIERNAPLLHDLFILRACIIFGCVFGLLFFAMIFIHVLPGKKRKQRCSVPGP